MSCFAVLYFLSFRDSSVNFLLPRRFLSFLAFLSFSRGSMELSFRVRSRVFLLGPGSRSGNEANEGGNEGVDISNGAQGRSIKRFGRCSRVSWASLRGSWCTRSCVLSSRIRPEPTVSICLSKLCFRKFPMRNRNPLTSLLGNLFISYQSSISLQAVTLASLCGSLQVTSTLQCVPSQKTRAKQFSQNLQTTSYA